MKREKLILEFTFVALLIFLAIFLQKLDAACRLPWQCTSGTCFNYDMAFQYCENWCQDHRSQQCADVWQIASSCSGSCNETCNELFGMMCMDGYTVRKNQSDFCAGCGL
jgi:hypothetical protein